MPPKPVLGLIGGIGSGKSRVAAEFARHGAKVISGDEAGHEALRQPEIKEQVVRRWGGGILDEQGEISRRRLSAIVFADPAERQALEAIVFPWIGQRLREQVMAAKADPRTKFVVLDAAVMVEAGWDELCDAVVFVDAPREVRLRRLAEQRGWTEQEVDAREKAQRSLTDKANRADFVLDNSNSLDDLARQVVDLLRRLGIAN